MRRLASARATSYQATSGWPFFGLCFFQTCACSSRVAAAIVRSCSSFGMLPSAITSSIGGCRCASSFSRRTVRTGNASASPIACSFQPWASSRSIARQMSTLDIEARIRFSATERIASAASSASHTSTSITGRSALIAAFTRRLPTTIISPSSFGVTQGGWMMPTALIEASKLFVHRRRHRRAAGIVRIGLEGTGIDAAKFGHDWLLWLGFHPPCVSGRPLPRGASRPAGARARAARGQRPVPCGGGRRCGSRFISHAFPSCPLSIASWLIPLGIAGAADDFMLRGRLFIRQWHPCTVPARAHLVGSLASAARRHATRVPYRVAGRGSF